MHFERPKAAFVSIGGQNMQVRLSQMRIRGTFQESQQSRDIQQLTGLSSIVFKKKRQKSTPAVAIAISHTERFFVCPPWREYLFFFNHSPRRENSVPRRIFFVFPVLPRGETPRGGRQKKSPAPTRPYPTARCPRSTHKRSERRGWEKANA